MGQVCTAGSRIFVQEGFYDKIMVAKGLREATIHSRHTARTPGFEGTIRRKSFSLSPQHDLTVYVPKRVMSYIDAGKEEGATVFDKHGDECFFIQPTIFTDVKPNADCPRRNLCTSCCSHQVQGRGRYDLYLLILCISAYDCDSLEVIEAANVTVYESACNIFSENAKRALRVAHSLEAGIACVR
jgi:aldehyde dehydrogenase (NAD+)